MKENKQHLTLSELAISKNGTLVEVVDFGQEQVLYEIKGVAEHVIYGIFFSFSQKGTTK